MILIKNAKLLTMAEKDYEQGQILINDGKIVAIGKDIVISDHDVDIIDAAGAYVTPGLIDPHCHIGLWEDGMGEEGADGNEETDPVTPHLRAIDGVNPFDPCFKEAYENGITSVVTGPGSGNVIGGQFVAMKTFGRRIEEMIIKEPAAMKIAFGENPKRVYSDKDESPTTRMAMAAILRENLIKAQEYQEKLDQAEEDEEIEKPDFDMKLDALCKVLNGDLIVKAHAHRRDDILTAVRIFKEFGLKFTIEHCTEGYLIADLLKEDGICPIVGPLISERSKIELRNQTIKAPALLAKKGIKFAIMTDHPVIPIQYLPVSAALAVREGLDEKEALKAITIYAAQLSGIDQHVGSLEIGKDADLVIWSGHPFEYKTKANKVMINGKIVFE